MQGTWKVCKITTIHPSGKTEDGICVELITKNNKYEIMERAGSWVIDSDDEYQHDEYDSLDDAIMYLIYDHSE